MDPYGADPEKLPTTDLYWDLPFYGRCYPKADDSRVNLQRVNSHTTESLKYWASVYVLKSTYLLSLVDDIGGSLSMHLNY